MANSIRQRWVDRKDTRRLVDAARALVFAPPTLRHRHRILDEMRLMNADALAALLKRHPRALLVAAGHVHRAAQTVFAGISAPSARPANSRSRLNSNCAGQKFSGLSRPLSTCTPGSQAEGFGSVVTHVVPIGEFPGPYSYGQPTTRAPAISACFRQLAALSSVTFNAYIRSGRGNPAMAINGRRNKPIGPGGSTRRLHQSPGEHGFRRGRNRIDEGVKGVLLLGMVPPLSGQYHSCQRQLCSGCSGRVSGLKCRTKALAG